MNTKYLKHFNKHLKIFRERKGFGQDEIASFCLVDLSVVQAWEADGSARCYPSLDNLLDLCFKTSCSLEYFIDTPEDIEQQLDLPGIDSLDESDLSDTLEQLDKELDRLIPNDREQELLKRFRKSDEQNKELILQLISS